MSRLVFSSRQTLADAGDRSQISALEVLKVAGQDRLYASTHFDGQLTAWGLTKLRPDLIDSHDYRGGLVAGSRPSLMTLDLATGPALLTGGGTGGGLQLHRLQDNGHVATTQVSGSAGLYGRLQDGVAVTLQNGAQAVFGAFAGLDGLGQVTLGADGSLQGGQRIHDSDGSYAAGITDVAHLRTGGQDYIYAASGTEHGISVWAVTNSGTAVAAGNIGMNEGLWIAGPSALETARVAGQDYLIVGSAISSTLSVMRLGTDGALTVTDHLLDTRDTRFGGVTAVEVVTLGNHTYVLSGGADDGITLHELIPGGQLVLRDTIADTPAATLANVSAIAVEKTNDMLEIYVSSSSEAGITRLLFDSGPAGQTRSAGGGGATLSGTGAGDVLIGGAGNDRLYGGGGGDILRDGADSDVLTGGAGADIFVLAWDGAPDVITDFTPGEDRLDLSGWPMVRDISQLTLTITGTGLRIDYGDETLEVRSADGTPIDRRNLTTADLIGGTRIPDVVLPGHAGPGMPAPAPIAGANLSDSAPGTGAGTSIGGQSFRNPVFLSGRGRNFEGGNRGDTARTGDGHDRLYGGRGDDRLYGGRGSDRVYGGRDDDLLYGGAGDDNIGGSDGRDRIYGGGQEDRIYGGGAADRILGGREDDLIYGGTGRDVIGGQYNNDRIYGGDGAGRLYGGHGYDRLIGGRDDDALYGGSGRDVLAGGAGRDYLEGGTGQDKLYGGDGVDRLLGGDDTDQIWGGGNSDTLIGGGRDDHLNGEGGNDRLYGGSGRDRLLGRDGNDTIEGGDGADTIEGGSGDDRILGGAQDDVMRGGDGWDYLHGEDGADWLSGGAGRDRIGGGNAADRLLGDDGADTLYGGNGTDLLGGGPGYDTLYGGADADSLYGGNGNDMLIGGAGDDMLIGGTGDDVLRGESGADHFVFSAGRDRIAGFADGIDRITLDADLVDGALRGSEIVALHGRIDGSTVTLDFGNGDILTVQGVGDPHALGDSISLGLL